MNDRGGFGESLVVDRDRYAPGMSRQLRAFRSATASGMPRLGWKVGINVPEVLKSLGLRHPGVGWLDGRRSLASGDTFTPAPGSRIRIEPELCISLDGPVPASIGADGADARIAGVSPAIEIVDYARAADGLDAVVGHSMFHAGFVQGDRTRWEAPQSLGVTVPTLRIDGEFAGPPPRKDLVPPDLGSLLVFVAAFLEEFGESLDAGDVVLTGSYTEQAVPVADGNDVRVDFGPLGSVALQIGPDGERGTLGRAESDPEA